MDKKSQTSQYRIKLIKSPIGNPGNQRETLKRLGLTRINQQVTKPKTPSLAGMIFKVRHLVEVKEE